MEISILLCGVVLMIIGAVLIKKERHGQLFLWLAIACFIGAIVLSGLRLLSGMNFVF